MQNTRALTAVRQKLLGTPHRMTKQRMRIVRVFALQHKYISAKQLHAKLRARDARIGLATIYRTLQTLRELDLLTEAQVKGETVYLLCDAAHHHHAVCTQCGRVDDVPCRVLPRLERMLSHGLRFRLTQHQIEFFGVCARCS